MTHPESGKDPEDPRSAQSGGQKEGDGLEGVIDELRSVLSDLGTDKRRKDGEATPHDEPEQAPASEEARSPADLSGEDASRSEEGEVFAEQDPSPLAESSNGAAPPDSDFWSGNVLGWAPDDEKKDSPKNIPEPQPEPHQSLGPLTDDPFGDLGGEEEKPPMDASPESAPPADALPPSVLSESLLGPSSLEEPTPPSTPSVEPPAFAGESPLAQKDIPKTSAPDSNIDDVANLFPAPPASPASSPPEPSSEVSLEKSLEQDAPPNPPPPVKESPPVPIPGTIEEKPAPAPPEPEGGLGFEETDVRPKGRIPVSCLYPQGEEKAGQQFMMKLKQAGEKLKNPLQLDLVYTQSWSMDNLDFEAWAKSSLLTGAEFLFLVVPRANQRLFQNFSGVTEGAGIANRVIILEQVPLRSLYSDILVELGRTI